ncbi:MAG TPA: metallophosphoesterase [Flavisolibacter sp.]
MTRKFAPYLLGILMISACATQRHVRFVLLPDTQYYAEKYPAVLDSQVTWVLRNAQSIDMVLQQGDLTQNNSDPEWKVVQQSFRRLDKKVPYVLAVGNHDMGSAPGKFADIRNTTLFNNYFPLQHMSVLPAYGGVFETGKLDNAYYLLDRGGAKWMFLSLEFGPRDTVLQWAGDAIAAHRDRIVVINTHSYMYSDSTRQGPGDKWRPQAYGVGKDTATASVNDGEQIWEKLVKRHSNIRFVFSGHVLNSGVGTLISINDAGFPVYQMLANYQSETGNPNGGNGWLRIVDMDLKRKTISVQTYSPFIRQEMKHPAHTFMMREVYFK